VVIWYIVTLLAVVSREGSVAKGHFTVAGHVTVAEPDAGLVISIVSIDATFSSYEFEGTLVMAIVTVPDVGRVIVW
jgi:hypothetical protein